MKRFIFVFLLLFLWVGFSYGADVKITEMPPATGVTPDDLFIIEDSPGAGPTTKKLTANFIIGMKNVGTWASPITSSGTYSLSADNAWGNIIYYNDTDTFALPPAVAGMNLCIMTPANTLITVAPDGTDVIVLKGTPLSTSQTFSIAAVAGNFVCLESDVANHWVTFGYIGTLTAI